MSVFLKQIDEIYEADTEAEAMSLIEEAKKAFTVTRSSITYKYKKSEDREFWVATIRKSFTPEDGE